MDHVRCEARPGWEETALKLGFGFYQDYWDESRYYAFTHRQIQNDIEPALNSLHQVALEFVDRAINDETLLKKLQIPEWFWPRMIESWRTRSPAMTGRFDLAYDGVHPPKMLEYNADAPGMVFETGYFQLHWHEQAAAQGIVPADSGQYNKLQDNILEFFRSFKPSGKVIHIAYLEGMSADLRDLRYLIACARHAGREAKEILLGDIQYDGSTSLLDADHQKIDILCKMYPWEWFLAEDEAVSLPVVDTLFVEPEWTMILSTKASLPLLWQHFKGHTNLLPAYFAEDEEKPGLSSNYVIKPVFSMQGHNISIVENGAVTEEAQGAFSTEKCIVQEYVRLREYEGRFPILGGWIANGKPAGICTRESSQRITSEDDTRFAPHIVI